MTLLEREIAAGADDLLRAGSYFSSAGSDVWLGYWGGTGIDEMWLRATNVTIPAGDIIDDAKFVFEVDTEYLVTDLVARIWCNDVDTATSPTSVAQYTGKVKTTAFADWTISTGYAQHDPIETVDLTAPLQEVIARGGWASGQAVGFILTPITYATDEEIGMYAYDDSVYAPPKLVVNHHTPATRTIYPPFPRRLPTHVRM